MHKVRGGVEGGGGGEGGHKEKGGRKGGGGEGESKGEVCGGGPYCVPELHKGRGHNSTRGGGNQDPQQPGSTATIKQ